MTHTRYAPSTPGTGAGGNGAAGGSHVSQGLATFISAVDSACDAATNVSPCAFMYHDRYTPRRFRGSVSDRLPRLKMVRPARGPLFRTYGVPFGAFFAMFATKPPVQYSHVQNTHTVERGRAISCATALCVRRTRPTDARLDQRAPSEARPWRPRSTPCHRRGT